MNMEELEQLTQELWEKHASDNSEADPKAWMGLKGFEAACAELVDKLKDGRTAATRRQINWARDEYATEEINIDDDAEISEAPEEGFWVSAWVWIPNEEAGT